MLVGGLECDDDVEEDCAPHRTYRDSAGSCAWRGARCSLGGHLVYAYGRGEMSVVVVVEAELVAVGKGCD